MPTTIGTAYVQILPTTEGIAGNLTNLLNGPTSEAGEAGGKRMGSGILKGLGVGAAAIGSAATAAIGGIVSMANQTAQAGDTIDKQSQKLGVTAEQYQALAFAAEHSGFSVETFRTAAKALESADFDGNIWDAVEAIQAIEDPAERAAAAQELLGTRAAQEMAPLINGTQTVEDYRASLEELGGMMSNDAVAASAAYEDAMTNMSAAIGGLKNGLLADFLPSMTSVINGVALLASGSTEGISQIEEGFKSFMEGLMDRIPVILEIGGNMVTTIGDAIIDHLPEILEIGGKLIVSLVSGLISAIPKLLDALPKIWDSIKNAFAAVDWAALGRQLLDKVKNGLRTAASTLVTAAKKVWDNVKTNFAEIDWKQLGKDMIAGIINGLKNAASSLYENVRGIIKKALGAGKDEAEVGSPSRLFAREIGRWIPAGIAVGIEDNLTPVDRALRSAIDDSAQSLQARELPAASAGTSIVVNMTVSGAEDPETWAETFARSLKRQVRMGAI